MKKRLLFYVRKGHGLGHLKRLSRIAENLSANYSCLFISGHREMSWMVPKSCEYYQIPFSDTIDREKFIMHIHNMYCPDAIFFDHSLNGNDGDIYTLLEQSKAQKILILRGVLDSPQKLDEIYYNPSSLNYLNNKIDHIFVACDEKIEDVTNYKFLDRTTLNRTSYIGYVAPNFSLERMSNYRNSRITNHNLYVVSTPGGGFKNYALLNASMDLARKHINTQWDIIYGPKNNKTNPFYPYDSISMENMNICMYSSETDLMNASADVLITRGGYNNLIEGIYGSTYVICKPMGPKDDEQYIHATRLARYYDRLKIVNNVKELKTCFEEFIHMKNVQSNPINTLNMDGLKNLSEQLINIL